MNLAVYFSARETPAGIIYVASATVESGVSIVADATKIIRVPRIRALKYTAQFNCRYAAGQLQLKTLNR